VLLIVLILAAPATVRISIRRRRLDRVRQGRDPADWAWLELRDTARDLGVDARETSTPSELAAQLAAYLSTAPKRTVQAAAALVRLQELVEDEVYGVPAYRYNGEQIADELGTVLKGLRRATDLGHRVTATIVPPTLVDRVVGRAAVRA
jgi:hypothetical protein